MAITASPTGALQLPYDQDYASQVAAATNQANQDLADLQQEENDQALQYGQGLYNANKSYQTQQKMTKNTTAGSGMLRSSRFINAQDTDNRNYTSTVGQLDQANTTFRQNAEIRRNAINSALQGQLGALAQAYGNSIAGSSGMTPPAASPAAAAVRPPAKAPAKKHAGGGGKGKKKHGTKLKVAKGVKKVNIPKNKFGVGANKPKKK